MNLGLEPDEPKGILKTQPYMGARSVLPVVDGPFGVRSVSFSQVAGALGRSYFALGQPSFETSGRPRVNLPGRSCQVCWVYSPLRSVIENGSG